MVDFSTFPLRRFTHRIQECGIIQRVLNSFLSHNHPSDTSGESQGDVFLNGLRLMKNK